MENKKIWEKINGIIIQALQTRLKAAKKVFVLKDSQYLTISKQCRSMAVRKHSINMIHGDKNNPDKQNSTKSSCIDLNQLFVRKVGWNVGYLGNWRTFRDLFHSCKSILEFKETNTVKESKILINILDEFKWYFQFFSEYLLGDKLTHGGGKPGPMLLGGWCGSGGPLSCEKVKSVKYAKSKTLSDEIFPWTNQTCHGGFFSSIGSSVESWLNK